MVSLDDLTLASAGASLRSGSLSPVELIEATLERIRSLNDRMNAFITVEEAALLEEAASLKAAGTTTQASAPLYGVPISLKDLIDARGYPTTAGSPIFAERQPHEDAPVVSKLRGAGAILVGKTNLHECAYGVTGVNPHYGPSRNPWDPDRISGGSSGGSAVSVILAMALGSIGTDTGGSIRIPAALCGAVGFKPTHGLVSTEGVVPLAPSFDHVGPIARTVRDVALMLEVMSDSTESYSSGLEAGLEGLRFGLPSVMFERLAPEVRELTQAAIRTVEKLGGVLADVDLPGPQENEEVFKAIAGTEAFAFHEPYLEQSPELYGVDTRERLEAGASVRRADYVLAQTRRSGFREQLQNSFEHCDLILAPTVPIPAPPIGEAAVEIEGVSEGLLSALTRNTRLFSTLGVPSISVPSGFTSENLPVGLQIAGPAFADGLVLRAANAYEQEAGWFRQRPRI